MSPNASQPPPDWLIRELRDGLRKLVSLSLESPPSADLIGATLLTWTETITSGRTFDRDRDVPRFRTAFLTLAARCRRWPVPADFIAALPAREPLSRVPRIESAAKRERSMRHIADIATRLHVVPGAKEAGDDSAA